MNPQSTHRPPFLGLAYTRRFALLVCLLLGMGLGLRSFRETQGMVDVQDDEESGRAVTMLNPWDRNRQC